jgi:hypothetical protein
MFKGVSVASIEMIGPTHPNIIKFDFQINHQTSLEDLK